MRNGNGSAQILRGYLNAAGIEAGYSYFAPNVAPSYRLVFELEHEDGTVDYDSFAPAGREANLRLAGLLDQLVKTPSAAMREEVTKLLAQSAWQRHPDLVHIKAVLGV